MILKNVICLSKEQFLFYSMVESETFRVVSNLAKNNASLRSRMAVTNAIMGRKPSYYRQTHPATKQPRYIK